MKTMSRISKIIDSMPNRQQAAVLAMREQHACLMELDRREKIPQLQKKCIFLNYISGEGRKLDSFPHKYTVFDGNGKEYEKETYFTYVNRVR